VSWLNRLVTSRWYVITIAALALVVIFATEEWESELLFGGLAVFALRSALLRERAEWRSQLG
jgi:hypothetical protein